MKWFKWFEYVYLHTYNRTKQLLSIHIKWLNTTILLVFFYSFLEKKENISIYLIGFLWCVSFFPSLSLFHSLTLSRYLMSFIEMVWLCANHFAVECRYSVLFISLSFVLFTWFFWWIVKLLRVFNIQGNEIHWQLCSYYWNKFPFFWMLFLLCVCVEYVHILDEHCMYRSSSSSFYIHILILIFWDSFEFNYYGFE